MNLVKKLIIILGISAIYSANTSELPLAGTDTTKSPVTKSPNDHRSYDYKVLENGLKVLVISDPQAARASASLAVNVGALEAPKEFPGLPHFLEHMLFLGSDKYPDPGEYRKYIKSHGGRSNAYTSSTETVYLFDIESDYLYGALKRFSRFFIAPTMDPKYVDKERHAVDSEYKMRLRHPFLRNKDIIQNIISPDNPYTTFSVGNLETLGKDTVHSALVEFYNKYYSADRMVAVIVGREKSEQLMSWATQLFEEVPRKKAAPLSQSYSVFEGLELPMVVKSQSLTEEQNLVINIALPGEIASEYSKSLRYILNTINGKHQHGLVQTLKKMGYVKNLVAGEVSYFELRNERLIIIDISLTNKGYDNYKDVLAIVFAYIQKIHDEKAGEVRYEEMANMSATNFTFKDISSSLSETSSLSSTMLKLPIRDIQAIDNIYNGYDRAQIQKYTALMRPENAVIQVIGPDVTSEIRTHFYDVPYVIEPTSKVDLTPPLSENKVAISTMQLPSLNPFVDNHHKVKKSKSKIKSKHSTVEKNIELFYQHDDSFLINKTTSYIALQPAMEIVNIKDQIALSLWVSYMQEALQETLMQAKQAGVDVSINPSFNENRAITIRLTGYDTAIPKVLEQVTKTLNSGMFDSDTFSRIIDKKRQAAINFISSAPLSEQAPLQMVALLDPFALTPNKVLSAMDTIDLGYVKTLRKKMLSNMAIRIAVYGNMDYGDARQISRQLSDALPADTQITSIWKTVTSTQVTYPIEETLKREGNDSALAYYLYAGDGVSNFAKTRLLATLLGPRFYHILRTEKQLGYTVYAAQLTHKNNTGMLFNIQSANTSAVMLKKHILDFNKQFPRSLNDLSEGTFSDQKNVIITELREAPKTLIEASSRYWKNITLTNSTQSRNHAIAQELEKLSLVEFTTFAEHLLSSKKHAEVRVEPEK